MLNLSPTALFVFGSGRMIIVYLKYEISGTPLDKTQNEEYIKKMILLILKEKEVSLTQAIAIFDDVLEKIAKENPVIL